MSMQHTRRYLSAILGSSSSSSRASSNAASSPPQVAQLQPRIPQSPVQHDVSDASDDENASVSSSHKSALSTDEMQQRLLDILDDADIAEEDKPDQLKELLASYVQPEPGMDLDAIVLGLLHRHREDLHPTGASFSSPQTPNKTTSMSRSPSMRRNLAAPGLSRRTSALSLNAGGPPSRPHSPSPLSGLKLPPHTMNDFPGGPATARHLSVAASEFRPSTSGSTTPGGTGTVASPGAAANWSFNGSPLGTPRYQQATAAQNSYFSSMPSPGLGSPSTKDLWSGGSPSYLSAQLPAAHHNRNVMQVEEPPDVFQHVNDWQRQQQLQQQPDPSAAGLSGGSGTYTMTPLDVLCSVFTDSGISSPEMEAALELHGWDVDKAIEHIITHHTDGVSGAGASGAPHARGAPGLAHPGSDMPDPDELARGINNIILPGAAPRQPSFGRAGMLARSDSFQSPRPSAPSSPRWGSRPHTPTGHAPSSAAPYTPSAASNRVCRYYLQGSCLRSDCRYNHDISKAVCRFWLRGHCLKGPDRCDFMHMIPPHLAQDVAAMKVRMDQERRERRERERELERDDHEGGREEDFPTLGATAGKAKKDPASTRWASAVKSSKPSASAAMQSLMADSMLPGADTQRSSSTRPMDGERQSPRIMLKPPVLLPTLSTGSKMSESYAQYRQKFLELGAARAGSLSKAAECWKRGDGAGARMWSREAQTQDLERLQAGRDAAGLIFDERKKLLRASVMHDVGREGRVDAIADRSTKGKEAGGGLGVLLGVASRDTSTTMSPEERTEVAIDLHGLHAEEATDILFRFLSGLDREAFLGTAYCVVGQEKHTIQGQVKTRLNAAVTDLLDQYKYPYLVFGGIIAVDPREHM